MKIHVPPKHEVKVMVGSSAPEHQVLVAMTKLLGRVLTDERSPDVQSNLAALHGKFWLEGQSRLHFCQFSPINNCCYFFGLC